MEVQKIHNLVIIGAGPAGLTAGIYAGRAGLEPIIIEGNLPGGQLMTTTTVENWPGEISIFGTDLMIKVREHAAAYGAQLVSGTVTRVNFGKPPFEVALDDGQIFFAKSIIIANGSSHKKLGCAGEQEYFGRGVTVCATCDAPFYKGKKVVVVGGGNSAMTEAEHLTHFASQVTILQLPAEITATDPIKDKVLAHPNVSAICNAKTTEIIGSGDAVTGLRYQNTQTGEMHEISCEGVFVAIGLNPNTSLYKNQLELTSWGHIKLFGATKTSVEGIFAAGDIADGVYQQAISSSGDGCKAALDAQRYLSKL
ncbi:thioredoxin-disulfide reductase [Candidatus Dependentiae bacterium]|nr:thioredoxin-disulfide reductase [Candidatus Dependentiae bacterium]